MKQPGPGKSYRKGISLKEAVMEYGDDAKAEQWFIETRWPDGVTCPFCDSCEGVVERKSRKPQPYHCKVCRKDFSVKTNTLMHGSKLPLSTWAMAYFIFTTHLKGVSSMKLHRDLGVTQKTAWHLAHRIRETWEDQPVKFEGPVEADETYIGQKEATKHKSKKLKSGRGTVGKSPVLGLRDRSTGKVKAQAVKTTDKLTVQSFVLDNTDTGAMVYSDDAAQYRGIPRRHESVAHSVKEYVREQASTNGIESFWAMLKRGQDGVYHHYSEKHLDRYVTEFEGRHNSRPLDTSDQMVRMVTGSVGKRLKYEDLIAKDLCK